MSVVLVSVSTPSRDGWTMAAMRARTRGRSTVTAPPVANPNSEPRRATCMARALATSALVGMQPVFTQVPPKRARSMMAVRRPAFASRAARGGPACPVPMTIASKRLGMQRA
ncbi:MAG: hypothetical protein R2712_30325 [Vicinamibacterales bacterium]